MAHPCDCGPALPASVHALLRHAIEQHWAAATPGVRLKFMSVGGTLAVFAALPDGTPASMRIETPNAVIATTAELAEAQRPWRDYETRLRLAILRHFERPPAGSQPHLQLLDEAALVRVFAFLDVHSLLTVEQCWRGAHVAANQDTLWYALLQDALFPDDDVAAAVAELIRRALGSHAAHRFAPVTALRLAHMSLTAAKPAAKDRGHVVDCSASGVGFATVASEAVAAGQVVLRAEGHLVDTPNVYTIQVGKAEHAEVTGPMRYLAHSCDPNCRITYSVPPLVAAAGDAPASDADLRDRTAVIKLVALRPVAPGELLTFDYCSSEWAMAAPFTCACSSPHCRHEIRGYKDLLERSAPAAVRLAGQLTPFIAQEALHTLLARHMMLASASAATMPAAVAAGAGPAGAAVSGPAAQ